MMSSIILVMLHWQHYPSVFLLNSVGVNSLHFVFGLVYSVIFFTLATITFSFVIDNY